MICMKSDLLGVKEVQNRRGTWVFHGSIFRTYAWGVDAGFINLFCGRVDGLRSSARIGNKGSVMLLHLRGL